MSVAPHTLIGMHLGAVLYYGLLRLLLEEKLLSLPLRWWISLFVVVEHLYEVLSLEKSPCSLIDRLTKPDIYVDILDSWIIFYCGTTLFTCIDMPPIAVLWHFLSVVLHFSPELVPSLSVQAWEIWCKNLMESRCSWAVSFYVISQWGIQFWSSLKAEIQAWLRQSAGYFFICALSFVKFGQHQSLVQGMSSSS